MGETIFLVTEKKNISEVFEFENFNKIPILDKQDVLEQVINTKTVKYIFSTWYFPKFEIDEIRFFFPNLKYIFYAAGDTSYFNTVFESLGIKVIDSKEKNSQSVAEFTFAQILLANKGYFSIQKRYKKNIFKLRIGKLQTMANNYSGNFNAKIGLLGFGSIARQLALLLRDYDFEVYAFDPFVEEDIFKKHGVIKSDLPYIFQQCTVVSNHLPDLLSTRNIIDYDLLSFLPSYATFINTGRGKQVNEFDLWRYSIKNKHFTSLLDVTSHEPLLPLHPLYFLNNVFITPHIAGSQSNEKKRMGHYVYQKFQDLVNRGEDN